MFLARVEHRGTGQRCLLYIIQSHCLFFQSWIKFYFAQVQTSLHLSSLSRDTRVHLPCFLESADIQSHLFCFRRSKSLQLHTASTCPHGLFHDFPMFECNARLIVLMMDPASHMDGFAGHLYLRKSLVRSGEGCSRHIDTYWICCWRGSRLWQWILLPFCMCRP